MMVVEKLMLQNNKGDVLPDDGFLTELKKWKTHHPNEPMFGPIVKHTWKVGSKVYERLNPRNDGLDVLPDTSGFILCEKLERIDNLVLLDPCGKERMRLSVPWQLTCKPQPEMAEYPSHFIGLTTPWENPETGEVGKFAVLAWVQYAGDYAFELDWETGQFLWGYFLERG